MSQKAQIFYYSRRKLGIYLLFNLGLLAMAILFTWSIFPDYPPVYYFALITCGLSILSSLIVFLIRLPVAIINDKGIKIDRNQPLNWNQVKKVEKIVFRPFGFARPILKITPQKISNYKMTLVQKIVGHSHYGSFSIPLYAMRDDSASQIEKLIRKYTAANKPVGKKAAKPTPVKPEQPEKKETKPVGKKAKAPKKAITKKAPVKKTTKK